MITVERSARDRVVWALFEDWCAACGVEAFPANPDTLARFIAANPAARGTQRRRVSVINGAHTSAGLSPPGHAEQIRGVLNAHRAARSRQRTEQVAGAVLALPTTGWPTLLFARRDAVMLVLSTTGMTFRTLAQLRVGDVAVTSAGHLDVHADDGQYRTPAALRDAGVSPAQILVDWLRVRAMQHQSPSTRVLAAFIRGDATPAAVQQPPEHLPLFTSLDRWGSAPLHLRPIAARAVRSIVAAHLDGMGPPHRAIQPRTVTNEPEQKAAEPAMPILLDPGSFDRGLAARRSAGQSLADVSSILDGVEDRADRILADLFQLLDG
ncbi:Uncharacterised protein [Mycobacteroides abscessus subsp. abscessus]|uniref:recombinase n=1 Tax=Mycobacteroides abscessus TaxID=36809 RepID=UPI0009285512|nr:recombinase [Mycobacteroides abscessus]SIL98995.1 Uncharacterised protein [Mycobacteroides abscessus subsp. abscessus]SLC79233.1 Uncharacterised protein [Mycobacteroides abscessus subsp. abscessus]